METLLHNLSEVFAVSIIHSLWQCLTVYLVLRVVLSGIVNFSAAAKHNMSVAALYYATLWFVYTLFDQASHYSWDINHSAAFANQPHLPLITTLKHFSQLGDRYEITIDHILPYITAAYAIGLVFHSLRLTSAWLQLRQLKQGLVLNAQLQHKIDSITKQIRLKKQVFAGYSDRIDIPCVAGYLKPVIMLPVSLCNYLSVKEVEAIIIHELAHVKRNDYFINALQQIMSVVFFFNPFIYLINRTINQHRENACDDLVIATTNEPLIYAQALLKIEQNNAYELPLALAATGKKYHLLTRIERIMKTKEPITNLRQLAAALIILIASSLSLAWLNPAIGNGKLSVKNVRPVIKAMFAAVHDTLPNPPAPAKPANNPPPINQHHIPKPPKAPKRAYSYHSHNGFSDPKLEAMGKEMEEYGKQIGDYYNSAANKKAEEAMEQAGKKMDEYYNSQEYKNLQEGLEKTQKNIERYYNTEGMKKMLAEEGTLGKEYEKAYGGDGLKNLSDQMKADGKVMERYYGSDEFKRMDAELRKKYNIPEMTPRFDKDKSEDQKNYERELHAQLPADVIAAQDNMKTLGKKMGDFYGSLKLKNLNHRMTALNDSINSIKNDPYLVGQMESIKKLSKMMGDYNNNPYYKNLQENMKHFSEQMRAYNNNPQMKELQLKMKELGKRMQDYTQTPEFKKKQAEWLKDHPDDGDSDK